MTAVVEVEAVAQVVEAARAGVVATAGPVVAVREEDTEAIMEGIMAGITVTIVALVDMAGPVTIMVRRATIMDRTVPAMMSAMTVVMMAPRPVTTAAKASVTEAG